ncbi:lysine N(6)-hydroxylase/L-ornithine N(5)-oxygenase family protein [Microvirga sp. VF16]|uniref:lysine N(6)-hydroxylase/L-ornithine N(5)-oxygenase family protein n=1 Tax=Microvirga sp. VF16 TaxID=2807101 RepID=UPI00193DB506|nr:lysine N(6)-hydroxylase/L-ornithine N(5)-oxygenase family protein [Microvirga sp. VF16]QRM32609.1 lysine N(6)-hydroxylase/L-ornithine N(5)-oxygenase family protein [Microvirga sp. VF16]
MTLTAVIREESLRSQPAHDVVGIGFGPSNLALAIALEEARRSVRPGLDVHFIERQPRFAWHPGMLLPDSDMQISFLKDLVSLRDPTSPFTFVNYLHRKNRLQSFINQKTFFPSRIEFNDYLGWAAAHFADRCSYGQEVVAVEPESRGRDVTRLRVISRHAQGREQTRLAHSLVLAVGGVPHVPEVFTPLGRHERLVHSSRYLPALEQLDLQQGRPRLAVVGAGQSAVEVMLDLHGRVPGATIDLVYRGLALKPSDDSPFVNEIFDTAFTDFMFSQASEDRRELIAAFRNTNYAVVDSDLLQRLYTLLYRQRVAGHGPIALLGSREITAASSDGAGLVLDLAERRGGSVERRRYDVVFLATGYRRDEVPSVLNGLESYLARGGVDRNYRLGTAGLRPAIFLQGCSEASHGLSDTLLSVAAARATEIADALLAHLAQPCREGSSSAA